MSSVSQLKPFLEPKSIAVVGANPNSGEQAFDDAVRALARLAAYSEFRNGTA